MAQLAMGKRTGQGFGLSGLSRLFGLYGFSWCEERERQDSPRTAAAI